MKAVHAKWEGAQKLFPQYLGDAGAKHSLTRGGSESPPCLRRLERRDFDEGNAGPVILRPRAATSRAEQSIVVERQNEAGLPGLMLQQGVKDVLALRHAAEVSKRVGRGRERGQ